MTSWWVLLQRLKQPRPLQGTGNKSVLPEKIRQMDGIWCNQKPGSREKKTPTQNRPRGTKIIWGGESTQKWGDQQTCGHVTLGQRPRQRGQRRMDRGGQSPLCSLLRRQSGNSRGASREDSTTEDPWWSTCGPSGASGYDHGGQGSAGTRWDVEEQGQRASRLLGDWNAAVPTDRDSVRGYALVWQAFRRRVSAPEAWKNLRLVFLEKMPSLSSPVDVPGFTTIVVNLLHEEKSRRERSQLRTHAGPNVHTSGTGNGRRTSGSTCSQVCTDTQHGLYGKLGLEDGLRCGQAFQGIKDSHPDKSPRTPDSRFSRSDMQDVRGSSSFQNSETGFRCGGPSVGDVWPSVCCGKLKKSGEPEAVGYPSVDSKTMSMCCVAWCGLTTTGCLATSEKDWCAWWTTSSRSCWMWTWSPSRSHCGGQVHTNTRRWGPCVWGTWTERGIFLFCEVFWCNVMWCDTVFNWTGRNFKALNAPCARAWERWWRDGGQVWTRPHLLALEWSHDEQSACLGSKCTASHLQASHGAGQNLGGLQNKNVTVSAKHLEKDVSHVVDRENCEQNLDHYDAGSSRRWRSNCAGSSCRFRIENDRLVEKFGILACGVGPPTMFNCGSTRFGFHSTGAQWDTPKPESVRDCICCCVVVLCCCFVLFCCVVCCGVLLWCVVVLLCPTPKRPQNLAGAPLVLGLAFVVVVVVVVAGLDFPGPPSAGPPKISLFFFPFPPPFRSFCVSLGLFLVEFWWCFEGRNLEMCTFGLLGCRVKPRRPHQTGPPGLAHDSPRTPNVHISGPRHFKHHKNSTRKKDTQKDTERVKRWREREEKARNFGPHPSGPILLGPHPSGAPPFWAPPFGAPSFWGPTFAGFGPSTLRGSTLRGLHPSGLHFFQVWASHPSGLHPSGAKTKTLNWPKSVNTLKHKKWPESAN